MTSEEDAEQTSLKRLYRCMQRFESKLGGGEGYEGIYGTITLQGMVAVVSSLRRHCSFTVGSRFVDVGAGLGRPLMHALVSPGVTSLWGIEVDGVKVQKALAFMGHIRQKLIADEIIETEKVATPKFTHSPIEEISSLDPYTHVYSFWEGVPEEGKCALGRLFTESETMMGLAVVQRAFRKCPVAEMTKRGFYRIELKQSIRVRMSGSGQAFHAYVFRKLPPPSQRATVGAFATPKKNSKCLSRTISCIPADRCSGTTGTEAMPAEELSVVRRSLYTLELAGPPPRHTVSIPTGSSPLHKDKSLVIKNL